MEIELPTCSRFAYSFGRLVDSEDWKDPIYLLDTSFVSPPLLTDVRRAKTINQFKGRIFETYYGLRVSLQISEDEVDKCATLLESVGEYFDGYSEFLELVVGECGLPVYTSESVRKELAKALRINKGFRDQASRKSKGVSRLIAAKKVAASKQYDYVKNLLSGSGILNALEDRGLLDSEDDPIYKRVEGFLKENSRRWTGKDSKGVDEELLAIGIFKALGGQRVIILAHDWDFDRNLRGFYGEVTPEILGVDYDVRDRLSSSAAGVAITKIERSGDIKLQTDTANPRKRRIEKLR